MRIDFVTLFPEMILGALDHSMIRRARERGLVNFSVANPRDFAYDAHRTVDDSPYGGGAGMVLKPEPVAHAVAWLRRAGDPAIVITDPTGERFSQSAARNLASREQVVFVCGHYEGIDDRIRTEIATHAFSIGDYILTGGELPALAMADAVTRLIPEVLGSEQSLCQDSHGDGLLSAPQFTRPEVFQGVEVPSELRHGNHKEAERWKRRAALNLTRAARPDLFCRAAIAKSDLDLLSF